MQTVRSQTAAVIIIMRHCEFYSRRKPIKTTAQSGPGATPRRVPSEDTTSRLDAERKGPRRRDVYQTRMDELETTSTTVWASHIYARSGLLLLRYICRRRATPLRPVLHSKIVVTSAGDSRNGVVVWHSWRPQQPTDSCAGRFAHLHVYNTSCLAAELMRKERETTCVVMITCPASQVVWLGGRVIRTLDLRSVDREFESWPLRYRVQPWASC